MRKENITHWIVPLKSERFNTNHLETKKEISFHSIYHFNIADYIYIYLTKPLKKIVLRGRVLKKQIYFKNLKNNDKKKKVHRIQLDQLLIFPPSENKLVYENLLQNGLNGPIRVALNLEHNIPLKKYISSVENHYFAAEKNNLISVKTNISTIFENRDKLLFFSFILVGTGISAGLIYYLLKKRK